MRNTPLWRPQPEFDTGTESASSEPATRAQRVSVIALVGVGLTLAAGIGAIGAFSFLGGGEPALAAAPSPEAEPAYKPADQLTSLPEVAKRAPEIAPDGKFSAGPAVKVIEVAVAQSESDVATLEEITGMVEPVPEGENTGRVLVDPVNAPNAVTSVGALRPSGDVAAPEAQVEAETADPITETASIQPDQVAVEPPVSEPVVAAANAAPALPALSAVKVNRYVNMRSGPADESRVIVVVPAGATVQAEGNCGWCTVTYKGQRGYIYKSFLQRGGATASADTPAKTPAAKPGLY